MRVRKAVYGTSSLSGAARDGSSRARRIIGPFSAEADIRIDDLAAL